MNSENRHEFYQAHGGQQQIMKPVFALVIIVILMSFYIVFTMGSSDRAAMAEISSTNEAPIKETFVPYSHQVPGIINDNYKYIYSEMRGITLWTSPEQKGIVGYVDQPNTTVEVIQKKDGFWLVRYNNIEGWASERILTANY